MSVAVGEVSWFCCGTAWGPCRTTGHGACGTCNTARRQHSWPNASSPCVNLTRPDRCGLHLRRRGCGFVHVTTNRCNGRRVRTSIADCGPNTHLFCHERHCCGSTCGTNRIIDLTASAYSAIANLSTGLRPCSVNVH